MLMAQGQGHKMGDRKGRSSFLGWIRRVQSLNVSPNSQGEQGLTSDPAVNRLPPPFGNFFHRSLHSECFL